MGNILPLGVDDTTGRFMVFDPAVDNIAISFQDSINPSFKSYIITGTEVEILIKRLQDDVLTNSYLSILGANDSQLFLISNGTLSDYRSGAVRWIVGGSIGAADNYASISATGTDSITSSMFFSTLGSSSFAERMSIVGNNVGIGTTFPDASAALDITSTTGSLLLPRMSSAERDALTAVNGMLIYNVTTNKFQGYENGAWANLI